MAREDGGDGAGMAGVRGASLFDAIFDAVFVVSPEGTVKDANRQALTAFAVPADGVAGADAFSFFSCDGAGTLRKIRRLAPDGGFHVLETRCLRRDGTSFQGELAIGRIPGEDGGAGGDFCFVVRDITRRHKAQQDLRHALERMEALGRARMEFVSNVSHELRTPLTSMIYAIRNMKGGHAGAIGERAMQYLERLDADCRRMLGTVNDILDLRQIENNTLTLARRRVAPAAIAAEAASALRDQAAPKGVRITAAPAERIDFAEGDAAKLERVFINIIGNAVKFTPSGGAVSVAAGRSPEFPGMSAVSVSDTGVGIPPEALPKVTARYFQVGDQPVGTGLGLAITKELVELHGGKMRVESPDPATGKGTRVTVALPLAAPPRIVFVSGGRSGLDEVLRRKGFACEQHGSGHAAMRVLLESRADAVVVCGDSADLPAAEFIAKLRSDSRLRGLPAVFVQDAARPVAHSSLILMDAFRIPVVADCSAADAVVAALLKALRS